VETAVGVQRAAQIEHPQEWPVYDDEAIGAVAELLRQGKSFDYAHGPEIAEIERLFSEYHDDRLALAFNSGTSALFAAYYSLGLGPGDEVLVPSYTFLATASPLFLLGAVPVLCDSGAANGNVTVASLAEKITERTRAIVVTHLFGHPCDMPAILALAREHGLSIVEDASHAHGSTLDGRPVGTFGDIAVFSIGARKLISGGMGGILLTSTPELYDRACLLGNSKHRSALTVIRPESRRLSDVAFGGNLRISPVAATLAASHMRRLDELVAAKRRNAEQLLAALESYPGIGRPPLTPGCTMGAWHDIVVSVDEDVSPVSRDEVIGALKAEGVKARVPSTRPLHFTSMFTGLMPQDWDVYPEAVRAGRFQLASEDFPVSTALDSRWISLPASYFNDPDGALVAPYVRAIHAACDRLWTA
jgi:perosamine synthetase